MIDYAQIARRLRRQIPTQFATAPLCEEIDGKVKAFLDRPIEGDWPYLWIDATYVKVRDNGRIVSAAVIVAVGANADGRREVLGMDIGPSEAETFWTEFLRKLRRRGLRGVKLVISDAHEGIKAAVSKVLTASWQRCRVGPLKKPQFTDSIASFTDSFDSRGYMTLETIASLSDDATVSLPAAAV